MVITAKPLMNANYNKSSVIALSTEYVQRPFGNLWQKSRFLLTWHMFDADILIGHLDMTRKRNFTRRPTATQPLTAYFYFQFFLIVSSFRGAYIRQDTKFQRHRTIRSWVIAIHQIFRGSTIIVNVSQRWLTELYEIWGTDSPITGA